MPLQDKSAVLDRLRAQILPLQGFKPSDHIITDNGLGIINLSFPNKTFTSGAVHEFMAAEPENAAASIGFLAPLLANLSGTSGITAWISRRPKLFIPALAGFSVQPDRFLCIHAPSEREAIWAMEESLKSPALSSVVAEISNLTFKASRRLQLAVEQSKVTGFLLLATSKPNTSASVSRWRISPMPSDTSDGFPGVGFPRWRVELLRVRNGRPGSWVVTWKQGKLEFENELSSHLSNTYFQKAG